MAINGKNQITALTSTRAIAAIMVFIYHYGSWAQPFISMSPKNLIRNGNIAVNYFFVLSGFVLYIAHAGKPLNYLPYIVKRLARIAPLYWVALAATLAISYWFNYAPITANVVQQTLYSALFLQSYIPNYALTLNIPAWSLSIEMFFYLVFPALLFAAHKKFKVFATAGIILYLASQLIHLHYYPIRGQLGDNILDTVFFSPIIHINQFIIGMLGGYIYQKTIDRPLNIPFIPAAVLAIVALVLACKPPTISMQVGLLSPLFLLMIIALAKRRSAILEWRPLVYLGEISYGIYILQYPVYGALYLLNNHYFNFNGTILFYAGLTMLILTSELLYRIIEMPVNNWAKRFGK